MQCDTPTPSTCPCKGGLLQSSPVQNCSAQKWPFQGLMVSYLCMEKRKNMVRFPWPLKNRAVKFEGQFSWNGVLNCSAFSLSIRSPITTLHPTVGLFIPISLSPLGGRGVGLAFCGPEPPLLWRQTRGWPSPTAALAASPVPRCPSRSMAVHGASLSCISAPPLPQHLMVLCVTLGSAGLCLRLLWWLVTDELDSLLSPGDWALARLWVQALSKSHS